MRYRKLGRTNCESVEIGYGAWGIGGKQWLGGTDDESLRRAAARDRVGRQFHRHRAGVRRRPQRGTGGQRSCAQAGQRRFTWRPRCRRRTCSGRRGPGSGSRRCFPTTTSSSAEKSLRNLKLETIDLQQLHVWNPEWLERDEWRRAFEDLKKSGKVRAVGVSINDHRSGFGVGR